MSGQPHARVEAPRPNPDPPTERSSFARRALLAVTITLAVLLLIGVIWYAIDVVMLIFAGILVAIFFRSFSDLLSDHTPLSDGWSLAMVVVLFLGFFGLAGWFLSPEIGVQVEQLAERLPKATDRLRETIQQYAWGRQLISQLPQPDQLQGDQRDVLARATGFFSTTLGIIVNVIIILFVGIYLAADPQQYVGGIRRLVPIARRERASEIMGAIGFTLRWWLLGRAISMVVVGVSVALGLRLLGVPLALSLGLLAGLLDFVPNIGPIVAAVPAVLLALMNSPMQALYVALLYFAVQTAEAYLLTPLVQQRAVSLPPVVTIMSQVLLGVLLGFMGLLLAEPLAATVLVLIKMLYVEDMLGDHSIKVRAEEEFRQHRAEEARA